MFVALPRPSETCDNMVYQLSQIELLSLLPEHSWSSSVNAAREVFVNHRNCSLGPVKQELVALIINTIAVRISCPSIQFGDVSIRQCVMGINLCWCKLARSLRAANLGFGRTTNQHLGYPHNSCRQRVALLYKSQRFLMALYTCAS